MLRITQQPSYILHTRAYRETSLLLELFTRDFGRLSVIAKGVKSIKRGQTRKSGLLQPFSPLLISCSGKHELLTLKDFETFDSPLFLSGRPLLSGFYLNELLMRLLHARDPHIELFQFYQDTLIALNHVDADNFFHEQIILRTFEKNLLTAIGYELPLTQEVESRKKIEAEKFYFFDPENGPTETDIRIKQKNQSTSQYFIFKGKHLLNLAINQFEPDPAFLEDAKRIMRYALARHLGSKPLESRKLFV